MVSPRPVQSRQRLTSRCRQMWVTDGGVEGMTADGMDVLASLPALPC